MAVFKCKMCGGQLEITENASVCTCDYCGTEQTLPRLNSDKKANLYDRANHFRRNNDYDKAMSIYEQILNEDNTDAEAYWSLVLCKYGIEYVEDPRTHKRIPTVNRAQYTSIYADENYKSAIQYADTMQKTVYEQEAKVIDEIQKGILAISEKEEPFDVFICYKETDDSGRRTHDSVLANDLYHQLTQEGFKVFFARITLEDKLGQEYEPYIFAALNSAKVMVVLGTRPEFFTATWVKNEWSRYLGLISNGAKKMLIPAYRDMDPYDLPEEFSHLQAQDMSKLGFMQDLIRGIKKILEADKPSQTVKETVVVQQTTATTSYSALLERGNMALEDEEWESADAFFEDVLNQDAKSAEAYVGKLLAKYKCKNIEKYTEKIISKYSSVETEKGIACEEDKTHIDEMVKQYVVDKYYYENSIRREYEFDRSYYSETASRKVQKQNALKEINAERLYARAKQYATGELAEKLDYVIKSIVLEFDALIQKSEYADKDNIAMIKSNYASFVRNADEKVKKLNGEALEKIENTYQGNVKIYQNASSIAGYEAARDSFKNMISYKDSAKYVQMSNEAIEKIREQQRQEAEREEQARRLAIKKQEQKTKITIAVIVAVVALIIAGIVMYNSVIKPDMEYKNAVQLMESGKYAEAISSFRRLGNYKDSMQKVNEVENRQIKISNIGDTVFYGNYNDNMEWVVLEKQDNKVLLISKYAICKKEYNEKYTKVTWENCTLRSWLNNEYIKQAFTDKERAAIISTKVVNKNNEKYGTEGGNDTTDKIFLLSIDEVNKYFINNEQRKVTDKLGSAGWWWLRSPGDYSDYAAFVHSDGSVDVRGYNVNDEFDFVRPTLWIDLSNLNS